METFFLEDKKRDGGEAGGNGPRIKVSRTKEQPAGWRLASVQCLLTGNLAADDCFGYVPLSRTWDANRVARTCAIRCRFLQLML